MAKINGVTYSKSDILRRVPNLGQLASVSRGEYRGGKADGLRFFDVKTGSGLAYTVLPGRCLDIASLSYRGVNISFMAKNGIVAPEHGAPMPGNFGNYITGGMMFTCGLLNAGPECTDTDGSFHPAHGRIGITPAEQACGSAFWEGDDYVLECSGLMRESQLFGHHLTLSRTITSKLGENAVELCDVLENLEAEDEEFVILYHFNFGFPFLSEKLKVHFPKCEVIPRTDQARAGLSDATVMTPPVDGFFEHVFFREPEGENGVVTVSLENPELGIGVRLTYENENLPVLVQWKSMRSGDYALGIEPANTFLTGRPNERKNGTLKRIKAGQSLTFRLRLECYDL